MRDGTFRLVEFFAQASIFVLYPTQSSTSPSFLFPRIVKSATLPHTNAHLTPRQPCINFLSESGEILFFPGAPHFGASLKKRGHCPSSPAAQYFGYPPQKKNFFPSHPQGDITSVARDETEMLRLPPFTGRGGGRRAPSDSHDKAPNHPTSPPSVRLWP